MGVGGERPIIEGAGFVKAPLVLHHQPEVGELSRMCRAQGDRPAERRLGVTEAAGAMQRRAQVVERFR